MATAWALMVHTGPASGFQPFLARLPSSRAAVFFRHPRDAPRAARRSCVRMDATDPVLERKDTVEGAVQPGVGQWWTIPDDGSVPVMCRESDPLPAEWQGAGEAAVRAFREAATRSGRPLLSAYVGGSVARGEALPGLSTFHAWAYFAPGTSGDSDRDGGAALLLETVAAQEAAVRAAARAGDCTHAVRLLPAPLTLI